MVDARVLCFFSARTLSHLPPQNPTLRFDSAELKNVVSLLLLDVTMAIPKSVSGDPFTSKAFQNAKSMRHCAIENLLDTRRARVRCRHHLKSSQKKNY
jgi:hypothetical protein